MFPSCIATFWNKILLLLSKTTHLPSLFQKFDEAANAFYEGVELDPESRELVTAFRFASFLLRFQVI